MKTSLDTLLDLTALLPSLLSRADRILPLAATNSRRLKAKDLLLNCTNLERQLLLWYQGLEEAAAFNRENPLLYWLDPNSAMTTPADRVPFGETYVFANSLSASIDVRSMKFSTVSFFRTGLKPASLSPCLVSG